MRKGEKTRKYIIMKSAELFNQKGYAGSSIQDIMEATGLKKGGIYRTFSSKDEIAVEAFEYAGSVLWKLFLTAIEKEETSVEKIIAACSVYIDVVNNPPIKGGCPLVNTAVETDDGYPLLRERALTAYENTLLFIQDILKQGIVNGEFRSTLDIECISSYILSSMQGSIMASRLTRDNKHVGFVIQQLRLLLTSFKPL